MIKYRFSYRFPILNVSERWHVDNWLRRVFSADSTTRACDRLDRSTRLLASPSTRLDSSNKRSTRSIDSIDSGVYWPGANHRSCDDVTGGTWKSYILSKRMKASCIKKSLVFLLAQLTSSVARNPEWGRGEGGFVKKLIGPGHLALFLVLVFPCCVVFVCCRSLRVRLANMKMKASGEI